MNIISMFDRICSSNVVIASQQRNEPEFTYEQKQEILNQLYKTNPANFIHRFGSLLTDNELRKYFDPNADYVHQILTSNRNKIRANRRYTYMQQLIARGSYFSDEAMKERSPLLYEQMIEKYNDKETTPLIARTANGPLADFYMEHLESINYQERLEKEFEKEERLRHGGHIESDDDDESDDNDGEEENAKNYTNTERDLYRQEFLAIQKGKDDYILAIFINTSIFNYTIVHLLYIRLTRRSLIQYLNSNVFYYINSKKFLNGEDSNIDYTSIDNNENLDDIKIREHDEEEKYFDDEDPYTYNGEEQ
ncbi:unnamed protein product [Rotaria socialis]|uniref:CCD97-like C-terminal domain-containing protein n=1 Tax=Rotaria socialis TaxID=392032 RepID=A0A817WWZ6_9BILA|nr:unnamed protein product [Rotaria socialis]